MKRFIQLAFLKALVVTVGFDLACIIYGLVADRPYETSFAMDIILFIALFLTGLIEYLWKNRKK